MKIAAKSRIGIVGAPTSAGAYAPGQEKAPAAFRRHGLAVTLEQAGFEVVDYGDVSGFRWRPDPGRPQAANLDAVLTVSLELRSRVAEVMAAGQFPLVLGGDCTIELGVVAAALRKGVPTGLVYIDRDADLNLPVESDGALDWTGVAHLLALESADAGLTGLGPRRPMLAPRDILYFGLDNLERNEPERMADLGLASIRRAEVSADPVAAAERAVGWASDFEQFLIHLDVDVLDFADFPFAENVRRDPGIALDALGNALAILLATPNAGALTITEVNPDHAPDEAASFERFNATLAAAWAEARQRSPSRRV